MTYLEIEEKLRSYNRYDEEVVILGAIHNIRSKNLTHVLLRLRINGVDIWDLTPRSEEIDTSDKLIELIKKKHPNWNCEWLEIKIEI